LRSENGKPINPSQRLSELILNFKNSRMKKNIILKLCVSIVSLFIMAEVSFAQVLVGGPTNPDMLWLSTPWAINGINTALIDYQGTAASSGQLGACAYGARPGTLGGTNGGVVVTDFLSGLTFNIAYPAGTGTPMQSVPDVIIGDNIQYKGQYIMAVGFKNSGGNVQIDYYDIVYSAPGIFSVLYHSNTIVPLGMYTCHGTVHMDVIAEHDNIYIGRPICNRFFITFDVAFSPYWGTFDVYAAEGSLSTYGLISAVTDVTTAATHPIDNWEPDVAAIEYTIGGVNYDVARITWVSQGNDGLFEVNWAPALGLFGGGIIAYHPGGTDYYYAPRIDADDDYTTNFLAAKSNYKTVYIHSFGGYQTIESHDDGPGGFLNVPSNWINLSSYLPFYATYYPGPYINQSPAVAFGTVGPVGHQYLVTEGLYERLTTFSDYFIMTPIEETDPTNVAMEPTPSTTRSYFQTNTNTIQSSAPEYANAVSTPVNEVSGTSLVAWTSLNAGNYEISYKRCAYSSSSSHGFAYRNSKNVGTAVSNVDIIIVPNPAVNVINITNAAGRYCIKNMLGQIVLEGNVIASRQVADISSLQTGNYTITVYNNGEEIANRKFVKN
jgi:Secretion system C-terminal sorting domain